MEVLLVYKKRAEDGTRIRDPNLGKVVLYQLSYFRLCFFVSLSRLTGAKIEPFSKRPNVLRLFFLVISEENRW